jgi:hypothetical protein
MKILDALVRSKPAESRYTLEDYSTWISQAFGGGSFSFQGSTFPLGVNMTQPGSKTEPIPTNFTGFVNAGLKGNGVVATCELIRLQVFSQARFQYRAFTGGRPGPLFGNTTLRPVEGPRAGQTKARMLLDADMAGNGYTCLVDGELVRLRPDWVDIVLEPRATRLGKLGFKKLGYLWFDGGHRDQTGVPLLLDEVAHLAPYPDPDAEYRGMSWLTPVLREIAGDGSYTKHKTQFIDNAATPNLAVSMAKELTVDQFKAFVDEMDKQHKGPENAGKTLYLGGGADVSVVGADMKQLDYKAVQGAGETRIAAASGVGAVIAQFSEGMQGSSLNAGNYAAARRRFADVTMRHLWQEAAEALEVLLTPPPGAHLWYDARDISFLQEDETDAADIRQKDAITYRNLVDAGADPDAAARFVETGDITGLIGEHSGLYSVQLQKPLADQPDDPAADPPSDGADA